MEKENISVVLRIRPVNIFEKQKEIYDIWNCREQQITLNQKSQIQAHQKTIFQFNRVYDIKDSNYDVYDDSVKNIVNSCLQGMNGTIFMYGQTGCGKTFTMMGNKKNNVKVEQNYSVLSEICENSGFKKNLFKQSNQDSGVLQLSLYDIFDYIENDFTRKYQVCCSYFEIYNDQIFDILENIDKVGGPLTIGEDQDGFFVKNLQEKIVTNIDEVMNYVQMGEKLFLDNRHYAIDLMLYFDQYYGFQQQKIRISPRNYSIDPINIKHSTLNFIDLAGSEKIQGGSSRVKESQHINKSLFFLTQIIQQLSQGRNEQLIPYRNSPLTKILKTSLGGNSKSLIVLCLNPCLSQLDQSLNTLRFGQNAKQIVNTFKVNTMKESSLDQQQMIQELHKKNNCLKDKENEYLKKINYLEEEKNKLASKLQYSESRNFLVSDVDLLRNIEQVQIRHNYDEKLNQYAGLLSVPKFQNDSMYTIQKEVANEKSKNYFKQDFVLKKISKCNTSDAQFNLKKVIQTYKKKKILLTKKILQKTQAENRKLNRIVEFYSDHDFDQIQKLSEKEIQTIQNNLQDFQSKLNMEMIFRKTLYQQGSCSEYMFIKDIISKNLKPQQIGINFFPKTFFEKNENLLEMTEDNVSSSKQSIDKQDFDIPTTLKLLNQVHKLNNKPVIKIEI